MNNVNTNNIIWRGENKSHMIILGLIFLMWGFITVLNSELEIQLITAFGLNIDQTRNVALSFFAAYFLMGYPAGVLITKIGYRKSITAGLAVAAAGAMALIIAALELNYPLLICSFFVLSTGFTILQVAANTYVVLMGDPELAASRLNLQQAMNSVGTWIAPLFAVLIISTFGVTDPAQFESFSELKKAQASTVTIPYIIIASIFMLLAIMLVNAGLPSVKPKETKKVTKNFALQYPHVFFGAIAIFLYVGAEVAIGSNLVSHIIAKNKGEITLDLARNYVTYYWGGAMLGRFIGAFALRNIKANTAVAFCALVAALLVSLAIFTTGNLSMVALVAVGVFNAIIFPTIFSLCVKNMGKLTEQASAILIMMISGGYVIPFFMYKMIDAEVFSSLNYALFIPVACYVYIVYFGLFGYRNNLAED